MRVPDFELERWKFTRQYFCKYDLTETGVDPLSMRDLLGSEVLDLKLDYVTTNGDEKLRKNIAALYKNVDKDQILETNGISEANFIATNLVINSGDEVVVEVPAFMQTAGVVEANGARIHWFHLREDEKYVPNLESLNELVTKKTKAIVLSHPNNPTGSVLDEKTVKGICEIAYDVGAWILVDEVYRGIEFEGEFSPSFVDYYDKAVIGSSTSKVWGLAGLRVGWMIGPKEIVDKGAAYREYTSLSGNPISEYLANIALSEPMKSKLIQRGRRLAKDGCETFSKWMDIHRDLFSWVKPRMGVIALVKHNLIKSSHELADELFKEKSVAVVPGEVFNLDKFLRICYGLPVPKLKEALGLTDDYLEKHMLIKAAAR
ncbi:MAG: aminotransferase class I/II-fold pyridoxal phosphate-dependent enzyme [Candidatus Bathyarchaeia archaeon]